MNYFFKEIDKVNNIWMLMASCCTFLASLLHILVMIGGPNWYRYFGAGEQMAVLSEQGHWYPPVVTSFITLVLAVWGFYALSASGVMSSLPLYKWVLSLITAIFLLRGLCIIPYFRFVPGQSDAFWIELFDHSVYRHNLSRRLDQSH